MKTILFCILFFINLASNAQRLWGSYSKISYSSDTSGAIFSIKPDGTDLRTEKVFINKRNDGTWLKQPLLKASNGFFYGTTALNPLTFKVDTNGNYSVIKAGGTTALIQASDGFLYGGDKKCIYKMDFSNQYNEIATLTGYVSGAILEASDGYFYATTGHINYGPGFIENLSNIVRVSQLGDTTTIYRLTSLDGISLNGNLVEGSDGQLYGLCNRGGLNGFGTAFKVSKTGIFTKIIDFTTNTGINPESSLFLAKDGCFYGTTPYTSLYLPREVVQIKGCIFKIDASGNFTKLTNTNSHPDFYGSDGSFVEDGSGYLYGVASSNVFKYNITTNGISFLTKPRDRGGYARCSLTFGDNGYLYGLISSYNSFNYDDNAIFRLHKDSTTYKYVYRLNYAKDGTFITTSLTQKKNKWIYGLSQDDLFGFWYSSSHNFRIDTMGRFQNLGLNAAVFPKGKLTEANDTQIYGVSQLGGIIEPIGTTSGVYLNMGTIYKIDSLHKVQHLFNFKGVETGSNPYGGLLYAKDQNLYGLCNAGGLYNLGTIYGFSPIGDFVKLFDFTTLTGCNPKGELIEHRNAELLGMTNLGGLNNFGTIFKTDYAGNFQKIYDFDGINGANPEGSLVLASDTNYYGLTSKGGFYDQGVAFKLSRNLKYTKLYDFESSVSGANPKGDLVELFDYQLYGTTSKTIFKIDKNGNFALVHSFTGIKNSNSLNVSKSILWANSKKIIPEFVFQEDSVSQNILTLKLNYNSVFPNPTVDCFYVILPNGEQISELKITNFEGKDIAFNKSLDELIYIKSAIQGIYTILIQSQTGKKYKGRVVLVFEEKKNRCFDLSLYICKKQMIMLNAISFSAQIKKGVIQLPHKYVNFEEKKAKIIILFDENITDSNPKKGILSAFQQMKSKSMFSNIEKPVEWQKELRNEW